MQQTLIQQAGARDNDYRSLLPAYRAATGGELVSDPFGSIYCKHPRLTATASIIIPAWNARDTLEQCLIAIEQSSFNRTCPQQLEVVVVDDGSTDGTWELLESLQLAIRLKAIRQAHHSRAHTQNTGIAVAEGDIIISCDADMLLTPFSIEELVKRHQVLEHVTLIGFRADIQRDDPSIQPANLRACLPKAAPPFLRDDRCCSRVAGWPESMCRDTDHLRLLGSGRQVWRPDDARWDLPGMLWGCLFSMRRSDVLAIGGYNERFRGWGCEDTLLSYCAVALGNYLLPVYSAAGLHIAHADRSPRKKQEWQANLRVFGSLLHEAFSPGGRQWLEGAKARVERQFERAPANTGPMQSDCDDLYRLHEISVADPGQRGHCLMALGRYAEAAAAFAQVEGSAEQEACALINGGSALRMAGCAAAAVPLLEQATQLLPGDARPLAELALACAAQGRFVLARQRAEQALQIDPRNGALAFLLRRPVRKHLERADFYASQQNHTLAARDYEAALIQEPRTQRALTGWLAMLAAGGRTQTTRDALRGYLAGNGGQELAPPVAAHPPATAGDANIAKVLLERARRARPGDAEVRNRLQDLHQDAARNNPLPWPSRINQICQAIPGWFGEHELELLIALTLQLAVNWPGSPAAEGETAAPLRLVEIGTYCGRATVAMLLALRGLGRTGAVVVTVDEPSLGAAPDGRTPRALLAEHMAAQGLSGFVVCAPEQESRPWERPSHLLLVDGRHDYASVSADAARYAPQLVCGGYLLFHDYDDYFPDVQRCVDELLLQSAFDFVAQAGSLIVLIKRQEWSAQTSVGGAARGEPAAEGQPQFPDGQQRTAELPVWMYWEGECPAWIEACQRTAFVHMRNVHLLTPAQFDRLWDRDRDINLAQLKTAHRADFIRAFLLARYGGLWIDSDCLVMRSLDQVLELLSTYDFVAHYERQGHVSNGFIAAPPGSEIAGAYYQRVCQILRSRQPLSWLTIGADALTPILRSTRRPWRRLGWELVQPICWSNPEQFFAMREPHQHEREFSDRAYCYMLANTALQRYQAAHPAANLMHPDSFFSFLLSRAMAEAPRAILPRRSAMGTSTWHHIPFCVEAIMAVNPARVLDVGIGFGRWGILVREFCEEWNGRVHRENWKVWLEGIEVFPKNVEEYHHHFYNHVRIGDADVILAHMAERWDLLILGDVLQQWRKPVSAGVLSRSLALADYVLAAVPLGDQWQQGAAYGNPYEEHKSAWQLDELLALGPVRHKTFQDPLGRDYGAFLFSPGNPLRL